VIRSAKSSVGSFHRSAPMQSTGGGSVSSGAHEQRFGVCEDRGSARQEEHCRAEASRPGRYGNLGLYRQLATALEGNTARLIRHRCKRLSLPLQFSRSDILTTPVSRLRWAQNWRGLARRAAVSALTSLSAATHGRGQAPPGRQPGLLYLLMSYPARTAPDHFPGRFSPRGEALPPHHPAGSRSVAPIRD